MHVFNEIAQNNAIGRANARASSAEREAINQSESIGQLEARVDWLVLACQAMWELLAEERPDADNALREKIFEIDMRDGQLDGAIGASRTTCVQCGRTVRSSRVNCMYCGASQPPASLFERRS